MLEDKSKLAPLLLIGRVYHVGQNDQGQYRVGVALEIEGASKPMCIKVPLTLEQAREWGRMLGENVVWSLSPKRD